ncbi:apoptosis-enhancing nuclease-like [Rhinoraja longicauda]
MPGVAEADDLTVSVPEGSASRWLLHGISCTARPLHQSPECRNARRKKKLSRRYQRFLERKAFLERRGLLKRRRVREKVGLGGSSPLQRQEGTELPSGANVNGDCCASSGAQQTKSKSERTKPSKGGPLVRGMIPLARTSLGEPPGTVATPRAKLGGFCCSAAKCVAIDCEMVGTGPNGGLGELARCSIVSYQGHVIYDKYVRPEGAITDYRTRWSGIREQHMATATEFNFAQTEIVKILEGKVVVGHALHNDFKVLKYSHPRSLTRDTSKMPFLKKVAGFPLRESVSLKNLAKQLLRQSIQVGSDGHCSVEDARTAMQLYRLVEVEWEQQLHSELSTAHDHTTADTASEVSHYMDDQYWPAELNDWGPFTSG